MDLHTSELGWTTYCVQGLANLSNHHYTDDGLIAERVTPDTATHVIIVEVEKDDDRIFISSVEKREL